MSDGLQAVSSYRSAQCATKRPIDPVKCLNAALA